MRYNVKITNITPIFISYNCIIHHHQDNDYLVSHNDDGEEVGFQDDDDMDEGPTY